MSTPGHLATLKQLLASSTHKGGSERLSCACRQPPFPARDYRIDELGEDAHGAAASLQTCRRCGAVWLKYLVEEPHFSRSGRWWRVEVAPGREGLATAATARACVEAAPCGFAGGSWFDSAGHAVAAPIAVF
jgi:hypothetical protein